MKRIENKLDELFQEGLQEHKMVPSRDIWAQIEAEQNKKRKKRFIIFFILFGIGIAAAGIYIADMRDIFTATSVTSKDAIIKEQLFPENSAASKADGTTTEVAVTESMLPPAVANTTDKIEERTNPQKQENGDEGKLKVNERVKIKDDWVALTKQAKSARQKAKANTDSDETVGILNIQKAEENISASVPPVKSVVPLFSNESKDEDAKNSNSSEIPVKESEQQINEIKTQPANTVIAAIDSGSGNESSAFNEQLPLLVKDEEITRNDTINLVVATPLLPGIPVTVSRKKFFVSAGIAPAYTGVWLKAREPSGKEIADARNKAEKGSMAMQGSINVGYHISKHFDISLGLGYSGISINSSYPLDIRVKVSDTVVMRINNFGKREILNRFDTIPKYHVLSKNITSEQRLALMRLPLHFSYHFGAGKSSWTLGCGGALSYLMKAEGHVYSNDSSFTEGMPYTNLPLRKLNAEFLLLAGYERKLADHWSCMLQPVFSFSVPGMTNQGYPLLQRYYSLAFWTGLKYSF